MIKTTLKNKLILSLSVVIAECLMLPTALAQDVTEWRYFTYLGVNDRSTQENRAFADDVLRATNGLLKITVYAAGELPYTVPQVLKAVASNQVQMGEVVVGGSGDAPELNILNLPFLCTSYSAFEKAVPILQRLMDSTLREKFGVDVLMHWTMPPQNFWLNRSINNLQDLSGMKIRTWNAIQVQMMSALGGSSTAITSAEVITALERKIIDGAITSSISANDWRAYEIIKTGYMTNMTMGYQLMTVNSKALAKLPPAVKSALIETVKKWRPRYMKMSEDGDIAARDNMTAHGVTLLEPSGADMESAKKFMLPIWDQWAQKNGPKAEEQLRALKEVCATE